LNLGMFQVRRLKVFQLLLQVHDAILIRARRRRCGVDGTGRADGGGGDSVARESAPRSRRMDASPARRALQDNRHKEATPRDVQSDIAAPSSCQRGPAWSLYVLRARTVAPRAPAR
jgi:hypothetical protein